MDEVREVDIVRKLLANLLKILHKLDLFTATCVCKSSVYLDTIVSLVTMLRISRIAAGQSKFGGSIRLIASAKDVPFKKEYFPFVNGQSIAPEDINKAQRLKLHAPASQDYLCDVICATEQQTKDAIEIADTVFENGVWSRADVRVRAKVLNNIAEELRKALPELVHMEVAQTGRAIKEMKAQVG